MSRWEWALLAWAAVVTVVLVGGGVGYFVLGHALNRGLTEPVTR